MPTAHVLIIYAVGHQVKSIVRRRGNTGMAARTKHSSVRGICQ
jgi:hypothetical protein